MHRLETQTKIRETQTDRQTDGRMDGQTRRQKPGTERERGSDDRVSTDLSVLENQRAERDRETEREREMIVSQ